MQSFNARIEKKKKYLVLGQILQFRGCSDSKTVAALFPFSRTASVKGVARLVLQTHAPSFSATWLISYVEIAPINRPVQFTYGQKESTRQARTNFMKTLGQQCQHLISYLCNCLFPTLPYYYVIRQRNYHCNIPNIPNALLICMNNATTFYCYKQTLHL